MNMGKLEKLYKIWLAILLGLTHVMALAGLVFFGALVALALDAYIFSVQPEWAPLATQFTKITLTGLVCGMIYMVLKDLKASKSREGEK